MIIDSHCHLDYPDLYVRLDDVVKSGEINQVKKLLTICTTLESFEKIKLIINKYKNIYGTFGIHPHESKNYPQVDLEYILNLRKDFDKIIGIGETGLDFYYEHSNKEIQKKSFIEHIRAASELNIPLIVHSRNAETETYEMLKSEKQNSKIKILMHCFTGTKDFAKKLLDLECYISVSGIITFKNLGKLANTITYIPIEKLLVETDCPYLAPEPFRGKVNEPSYIVHTVEKLAQLKNVSKEIIMESTTKNFKKLFCLN